MKKKMKRAGLLLLLGAVCAIAAACGGAPPSAQQSEPNAPPTPAERESYLAKPTRLVFYSGAGNSSEVFEQRFGTYLRDKYPQLTIEYIARGQGTTLPELIAAGQSIDIIYDSISGLTSSSSALNYDLQMDLTDLARKHGMDPARFEPATIDTMTMLGGLYGFPFTNAGMVLFYNKGLFDKFGVPYPRDGMTWEETAALAAKMNRSEAGVNYVGFGAAVGNLVGMNSLSLPAIDRDGKPGLQLDGYKQLIQSVLLAPGMVEGFRETVVANNRLPNNNDFQQKRTMAMYASPLSLTTSDLMKEFDWDLVSLPVFSSHPTQGTQTAPGYYLIPVISKQPDAAMEAIIHLTSDEVQSDLSRKGIVTSLRSEQVKQLFGADLVHKGKNFAALYVHPFAPSAPRSIYDAHANQWMQQPLRSVIIGEKDINTMIREEVEKAQKAMEQAKAQAGVK